MGLEWVDSESTSPLWRLDDPLLPFSCCAPSSVSRSCHSLELLFSCSGPALINVFYVASSPHVGRVTAYTVVLAIPEPAEHKLNVSGYEAERERVFHQTFGRLQLEGTNVTMAFRLLSCPSPSPSYTISYVTMCSIQMSDHHLLRPLLSCQWP